MDDSIRKPQPRNPIRKIIIKPPKHKFFWDQLSDSQFNIMNGLQFEEWCDCPRVFYSSARKLP